VKCSEVSEGLRNRVSNIIRLFDDMQIT